MQKTAYELRISDWSSDVCSSDLLAGFAHCIRAIFKRVGLIFKGVIPHFIGGHIRLIIDHFGLVFDGVGLHVRLLLDLFGRGVCSSTSGESRNARDSEELRSAGRRVGEEGVSRCRPRWSQTHQKKKQT